MPWAALGCRGDDGAFAVLGDADDGVERVGGDVERAITVDRKVVPGNAFGKHMWRPERAVRVQGELPVATTIHPLFVLYSESYAAYLASPEWKKIRARVLKRDGKRCQHCSAKAQCVHHISYDEPVIIGERDEDLISLCNSCVRPFTTHPPEEDRHRNPAPHRD
jgi:hypothetical protein